MGENDPRTYTTGTGQRLTNVHDWSACYGHRCPIHNPSDHSMVEFPTHWRGDRRIMERICPHGVGHPDPDDLAFQDPDGSQMVGVHGCDGCCDPTFTENQQKGDTNE